MPRCYEIRRNYLAGQITTEHPLKQQTVSVSCRYNAPGNIINKIIYNQVVDSNPLSRALEGTDPLSQFARQDEERDDPLSQSRGEFVSTSPSLN